MKNELEIQRSYWNAEAAAFEKIYTHGKSSFANFLDRVFRVDMYLRYNETIERCAPYPGRTFLDVGCGNGLFSIELARRGAEKVTGIDIAEKMIELCRQNAEAAGVAERCSFVLSDILHIPTEAANVTFAMGVFDYIRDPLPELKKMRALTKDQSFVAFPRFWTWRAPVRKIRLTLRGCPVFFYTKKQITALMTEAGFTDIEIITLGKIFFVIGRAG
jgi:SAM-dependent methyltransferase